MARAARFLCLALLPILSSAAARAAEPLTPGPWAYEVVGGITLTESAFSDNWSGGDSGSLNWVAHGLFTAKRQINMKLNWSNELQLAYGQTSTQVADAANPSRKVWSTPDKTTDLIMFESVGRFTLGGFVDPYLSFRLDSQFLDESDPLGQLKFNPVKLSETAGVAKLLDCRDPDSTGCKAQWLARVGVGFRQAFAQAFVDTTGDATERFTTNDGGLEFQTTAKYPLAADRISYEGRFLVFLPVFYSNSDALKEFDRLARAADPGRVAVADYWKAPDVNFQNLFTSELTSWLNVTLYLQLVYDKFDAATNVAVEGVEGDAAALDRLIGEVDSGIRKAGQFKQTLGIGLTHKF